MSHAGRKSPGRLLRPGRAFAVMTAVLAVAAAAAAVAAPAGHLLLSEVQTLASAQAGRPYCSEFIEIVNASGGALDLSDYYLSDATYSPAGQYYYRIAEGNPTSATAGGGSFADFHARFPNGFTIAAGDTVVIAIAGSAAYQTAYGRLPDLELYEDGNAPDQVPDMREAFPGSIGRGLTQAANTPTLDDGSESLILYAWNGSDDLVDDVDFAFWGSSSTIKFNKDDVVVGTSTYLPDTPVASQQAITASTLVLGESYMRLSADEGAETHSGGNGLDGHDETSEPLAATWDVAAAASPALQPSSFFKTVPVVTASSVTPAAPAAGQAITLSVTAVSYSALQSATFYVAYDRGPFNPVSGTAAGGGVYTAALAGQTEGTVVSWYAVVANTDGGEAVYPFYGSGSPLDFTVAGGGGGGGTGDAQKLLITEVCTLGTEGEFVEIYNPNAEAVDLTDYYLTDSVHTSNMYWMITQPNPQANVGGGAFYDFYARFPAGFSIGAGDTLVVSIAGSGPFETTYGKAPDLELFEDGGSADEIPDMLPLWGTAASGSIVGETVPGLTNGGETVILLYWDGSSDLITDIDVFAWKDPTYTSSSFLFDKTGVTVGTSTYGADTPVGSQTPFGSELTYGDSYQRLSASEGDQTATGGNGVDGRDETSEDWPATFAMAPASPGGGTGGGGGGGGTGGQSDAAEKLLITEVCYGPNVYPWEGMEDVAMDFVEINNPNDFDVDLSDYYLTDAVSYVVGEQLYWNIAAGNPTRSSVGGGDYNDFTARFPDGFVIPAHETIVVSICPAALFASVFGFEPDIELYETADLTSAVPDMRPVFTDGAGNSIYDATNTGAGGDGMPDGIPELDEHYGEPVVLFFWDGETDLVTDIDFFVNGTSKTGTYRIGFDKTNRTVGESTFYPDTPVADQVWFSTIVEDFINSYQRVDHTEGAQVAEGGNGVGGRDETSEVLTATFEVTTLTPGSYPYGGGGGGGGDSDVLLEIAAEPRPFLPAFEGEYPIQFRVVPEHEFELKIRLFDLEGRLIRTLLDSRFDRVLPGIFNTVKWDGRNSTFELVPAGTYICHVQFVDEETSEEEIKTLPVVVATRLSN